MDVVKAKWKKNMLPWTWFRLRNNGKKLPPSLFTRSKSSPCTIAPTKHVDNPKSKQQFQGLSPPGCFSVYVGPNKQRFVVKTEFANHPLFQTLLEDAESEFGHKSSGPILLPCDVNLFYRVLAEMDSSDDEMDPPGCTSFVKGCCSPARHSYSAMNDRNGHYSLLSPSRMIKLNKL